jgi:hypothetical protein
MVEHQLRVLADELSGLIDKEVEAEIFPLLGKVSRRIKVSEKGPEKPTSAAKLAAAREAGKKGGLAKSAAKTTSNRANAKKPRPSRRGKPVGKRWS